jgi:PelA/Pel-15E family pectate lyase
MGVENPSPQIVAAVDAAVAWLDAVKLQGIRVQRVRDPNSTNDRPDRVVVADPAAAPIWARFYEIGTNRPLFADRDGVPKYSLAEIGFERRSHYNWLDAWPKDLLETQYPAWRRSLTDRAAPK